MSMNVVVICLFIIGILYSGLTILAGSTELKEKNINLWSCLFMIIGGIIIILSIIFKNLSMIYMFILLITGLIMIHIAAIRNGLKMYGKLNLKHHLVRLGISILIIVLYIVKF